MHCRTNSQKLLASGTRRIDTAFKLAKQFPLVYCLFPGKSRSVYEKCFLIIDDKVSNLGFLPVVQRITTDFELALIQAAEAQFPGATSKGCCFHFSQDVWWRVQQLGLQQAYKTDTSMSKFFPKILALSFFSLEWLDPSHSKSTKFVV